MGEYVEIPCRWCGDVSKWYVRTKQHAPETVACQNCNEIRRRAEVDIEAARKIIHAIEEDINR